MEDQLAGLLANTQLAAEGPRKQAELDLKQAATNPAFPLALVNIAAHSSVATNIRQASLMTLRRFIERNWSEDVDDDDEENDSPRVAIADHVKDELRPKLLELAISDESDRKVKASVSFVVSKIATVDFPHLWPALIPSVLCVMPAGTDNQLHGALKVLNDLVEESLSETQFFSLARDIVQALYAVVMDNNRKPFIRALAVSVFRSCFDIMATVKDDHPQEVKDFAEAALAGWLPFFQEVVQSALPELGPAAANGQPEEWNGFVALKLQVVKTLAKIKAVFPGLLLPQSILFFEAVWAELNKLAEPYAVWYVQSDSQGGLEDADNLAYTLDFLVLEELDFLNQCMRAVPVQKHLEDRMNANGGGQPAPLIVDMIKLLVSFARITNEEAELWDIDVSLYLAEEGSVTTNYTARTACGDFLIKLGEWQLQASLEGLFAYTKSLFAAESGASSDWRSQEAALYLATMLFTDVVETEKVIPGEIAQGVLELVNYCIGHAEQESLLQARGYLVAGTVARSTPGAVPLLDQTIQGITSGSSELVNVACIKAIDNFMRSDGVPVDRQLPMLKSIESWLNGKDLQELGDADDLLVTVTESLRGAIGLDRHVVLNADVKSLDLLFLLAQHGVQNLQITSLAGEIFEEIVSSLATDAQTYSALCDKVLPSLTGAFNYADITQNESLITFAAELISILLRFGVEPLPAGLVAQLLPKLNRILMESNEGEILRPAAEAVKFLVMHDHHQVFAWQEGGKSGLEVCLFIIDRLLGPTIEDNSASEVGGLAAELVEKAGQERLGPYLLKLLEAVAKRLASAEQTPLIQSCILVFARLSLSGARDVVEFLSGININGQTGLEVVMAKWLEYTTYFAGFDEIRQNVIALSKVYALNDTRVAHINVKGDLVVDPASTRIVTRSRSKQTPDQYTIIPAPLKMLKLLIDELSFAAGRQTASSVAAEAARLEVDEDDGDDGWEDDPFTLDLALGTTKNELMSYFEGGGSRFRDDHTQAYLTEFFITCARDNTAGFSDVWYPQLTGDEKKKLDDLATQAQ